MAVFKLIKELELNLKKVETENPTNFITKWFKNFRIREIQKRIVSLRLTIKKK